MFKFLLTTSTTAAFGLAIITLAWLENAAYFVA